MAYTQYKNYWLSDDFDRFYHLIANNQTVIYISDKSNGRFDFGTHRQFGAERWGMRQKFWRYHVRFIDPECTFNPEAVSISRIEPDGLYDFHAYEKETLHEIGGVFKKHAEANGKLVDICGKIVDNWNFKTNPSL